MGGLAHMISVPAPVPLRLIGTLNWDAIGPGGFRDKGFGTRA